MPTYCYKCENCGYQKEEYLSISKRNNLQECPKCSTAMIRLLDTGSGFYLKGKGFYKQGWTIRGGNNE